MQNNPIGVFDSGVGGLSVLQDLVRVFPNEDFFYYGDTSNNPYGEKSQADLEKIIEKVAQNLIYEKQVKMVVIACNTATTRCIKFLQQKYPEMIFVGTEPAIKNAFDLGYGNILVMATPGTIESDRVKQLIQQNQKAHQKITLLPCKGLANVIEKNNKKAIDDVLHQLLDQYDNDYDAIILGCTHYISIQSQIQSFFPAAELMNSNKEIMGRVKALLEEKNLASSPQKLGRIEYFYSK